MVSRSPGVSVEQGESSSPLGESGDQFFLAHVVVDPRFAFSKGAYHIGEQEENGRANRRLIVEQAACTNGREYTFTYLSGFEAAFVIIVRCLRSGEVVVGAMSRKNISVPWSWSKIVQAVVVSSTDMRSLSRGTLLHLLVVFEDKDGVKFAYSLDLDSRDM
ncbi:MAG: hypothetical protein HY874_10110 [Chloroflexi bacterium]|nr:hypothetical protein [Chloroflexota bacterium]